MRDSKGRLTRIYKFRAWDKKEKKMYYPEYLQRNMCLLGSKNRYWSFNDVKQKYVEIKDLIPIQWAGLQDKNRKEIYEGDIVRFKGNYCTEEFMGEQIAIIKWDKYECCFYLDIQGKELGITCTKEGFEVMGNTYENPELLRGE